MSVETGYIPEPSNGDTSTWKNKTPEQDGGFHDAPAGNPEKTVNSTDAKTVIKETEENLNKQGTPQPTENIKNTENNNLISQIEKDLAEQKNKLTGATNAYPESYQKLVKEHIALLEKALAQEQAKVEKNKYIDDDAEIKAMRSILLRQDLGPKDREAFKKMLDARINRLKEGKELKEGELSPEALTQEKNISEVAMRAVDPVNGTNILERDKRMSYTRDEIAQIFQENIGNPEQQKTKLKEYLINSLDESIKLRNEAKYGKGHMGKLKKFFNEGWVGGLLKTAGGAGLISGGLYSGAGIFSPMIYGAGLRLASEGLTQVAQEINNAFNKNSRKALLEQGRGQLEQMVDAKLVELANNPEINTQQQCEQALMEFISKTYANEVKTLVDNDTDHLRKAEKLRRIMGWAGTASGLLVGMPMDIDADGASHFVNLFSNGTQGSWFSGAASHGFGNGIGLGSWGAIENLASYGAGSLATFAFARGTEGDERKFELALTTTAADKQKLQAAQEQPGIHITTMATPEDITAANAQRAIDSERKKAAEKTIDTENNPENKKHDLDEFIDEIQHADNIKLKEMYEKETGQRQELVGIKVIAEYPESIEVGGDKEQRNKYFKELIKHLYQFVLNKDKNRVSQEKAAIIVGWIKKMQKNVLSLDEVNNQPQEAQPTEEKPVQNKEIEEVEALGPITEEEVERFSLDDIKEVKKPLVLDNDQQHYLNELYYDYLQLKGNNISNGETYNNAYYGNLLKKWLQEGSLTGVIEPNNIAGSKDSFYKFLDTQTFSFAKPTAGNPENEQTPATL